MDTQLYIPKRIKVGYQKRDDTYSKRLAYIIYWDDKGKLRKETSWEGWRDKKIAAEEYDNVPTSGFVLHKDIKRYNWGHFSSKRTMIRVFDPRGIEFEITTENLIGVLMNTDCSKRALVGDFVYAWSGPELVLLPTNAEEYENASQYTALQAGKVGVKDLVPGCVYRTKKQVDYTYVGRYPWYTWHGEGRYDSGPTTRKADKLHIFTPVKPKAKDEWGWERWMTKSSLDSFATRVTQEPVDTFADIIETFQKETRSAAVVKWEVKPCEVSIEATKQDGNNYWYEPSLKRTTYFKQTSTDIEEYSVRQLNTCDRTGATVVYTLRGYVVDLKRRFDLAQQVLTDVPMSYELNRGYGYHSSYDDRRPGMNAEALQQQGLGDLYAVLDNGRRVKVDQVHSI